MCQCRRHRRHEVNPWVGKIPWWKKWQPIPVFLPVKTHGQRSLAGYSPLSYKELDLAGVTEDTGNHYIYYCGQESLGRNGIALTVNKRA